LGIKVLTEHGAREQVAFRRVPAAYFEFSKVPGFVNDLNLGLAKSGQQQAIQTSDPENMQHCGRAYRGSQGLRKKEM
jgi:hypothetical protein